MQFQYQILGENKTVSESTMLRCKTTADEIQKPIRDIVDVPTSQRSNFPSNHPLVVQAWSNVDSWQDTKEGAITPETAFLRATMLLERDSAWIGQHRLVRIVPRVSERMPRI